MFEKFIKATDEYTTKEKSVNAPYIRKTFEIDFVPKSACVSICTPGFYMLYINGYDITKGFLAPYIANPNDVVCYDEYDILPYLTDGNNCIAFVLGNGFANQSVDQWDYDKANFRAPLCASVYLKVEGENEKIIVESDETFKTHPSAITYDMYRYGTHYDARLEIDGWNLAEFDDSEWTCVSYSPSPKGEIVKCSAHPITIQRELSPVSVTLKEDFCYLKTAYNVNPHTNEVGKPIQKTHIEKGYLYDFGISRAGVCRLKIKGKKGQKIIVRHGEKLDADGNFNINSIYSMRDNYEEYAHLLYANIYILKGGEEEIFVWPFTYHGFRYAFVEGLEPHQATSDLLTYIVFNSNVKRRTFFECSDNMMNTLYEMGIGSDESNFHYFPTDCPHREKNGWTGDINASAEQYSLHYDWADSMALWLKCVRCAQVDGVLPGTVPTVGKFYDWGNGPAWDGVCVNVPYYIYKYDGRIDILEENASMIEKYLKYATGKCDKNGLVEFGLGDWCQPFSLGSKRIDAPLRLTASAILYDISKKAAFIFDVLNMKEQSVFAEELSGKLKAAIRKHLIDFDTMSADGNCQTSQALLLAVGIFEKNEYDRAYKRLVELIKEKDEHLHCGVIGLRYIFEVLCFGGDIDLALKMILRPDAPSYAYTALKGATALCETLVENGLNESENHHFLGDFIRVFVTYVAGIRVNPYMKDVNEVIISPIIPTKLESASARYETQCGEVSVYWQNNNGQIHFSVYIPKGVKASFEYKGKTQMLKEGKTQLEFLK